MAYFKKGRVLAQDGVVVRAGFELGFNPLVSMATSTSWTPERRVFTMAEIHNRLGRIVLEVAISSTCYRGRHQVGYAQVWI